MQYHAHALADSGVDVDLVGYEGTPLPKFVTERSAHHRASPGRGTVAVSGQPAFESRATASLAVVDALRASVTAAGALMRMPQARSGARAESPGASRRLQVTWLALAPSRRALRASTGTISATRSWRCGSAAGIPPSGWRDGSSARGAARDAHLCVSRGFARFSRTVSSIPDVHVLYDRPASAFVPIERTERERFRQALFGRGWASAAAGAVGFIVCPTSWTEDEDFDVVIDAVVRLEDRIRGWEAAVTPAGGSRIS